MDIKSLFVFLAFGIDFFLLLFIHFHMRKKKVIILLEGVAALLTLSSISLLLFFQGSFDMPLVWGKLSYAALTVIPSLLFWFAWLFPHDKFEKRLSTLLIVLNTILAMLVILTSQVFVVSTSVAVGVGPLHLLFVLYWVVLWGMTLYVFIKKHAELSRKVQISYMIVGTVLLVPLLVINGMMPRTVDSLGWIGMILGAVSLAVFTYAVFAPRLMSARLFLIHVATYMLMGFVLGSAFFIGQSLLRQLLVLPYSSEVLLLVYSSLFFGLVFLFEPLKEYLTRIANAIFYRNLYDSEQLLQKLDEIEISTNRLPDLVDSMLQEMWLHLQPLHVEFTVFHDNVKYYEKGLGEIVPYDPHVILSLGTAAVERKEKLLFLPEIYSSPQVRKYMNDYGIELCVPVMLKKEVLAVLTLGPKAADGIYTSDEIDMFTTLMPGLAVAVATALEYEELIKNNSNLSRKVDTVASQLKRERQESKKLDEVKDEFMSIAAHEMRTPLTVIRSYLWMMLQNKAGKLNKKQKMYVERSFTSADRLISKVNDMLNVARIESGRMSLVKVSNDIVEPIRNVISGMSLRAQELSIGLTFEQKNSKIPKVEFDSEKIEQVLINVIDNALKFTPAGGKIMVSLDVNEAQKEVVICVTDNGIGINKDDMSKLFHKFSNPAGEDNTHTNLQSTGLGLYISKAIVRMHGGRMWAESEGEGKGAKFYIVLSTK